MNATDVASHPSIVPSTFQPTPYIIAPVSAAFQSRLYILNGVGRTIGTMCRCLNAKTYEGQGQIGQRKGQPSRDGVLASTGSDRKEVCQADSQQPGDH